MTLTGVKQSCTSQSERKRDKKGDGGRQSDEAPPPTVRLQSGQTLFHSDETTVVSEDGRWHH